MSIINASGLAESTGEIFKTVPSGKYNMRVREVKEMKTKETSSYPNVPMLRIVARIVEGEEGEGNTLSYFIMLPVEELPSDQRQRSLDTLKNFILACGLDVSDDQIDTDDFIGAEFCAVVTEETATRDGVESKRNNIQQVIPVS